MYMVYFIHPGKMGEVTGKCIFMSSIESHSLAQRIADNLEDERFVARAWVEVD